MVFPGVSDGKESPAVWETWVRSLVWEDPLEEGMATHSSVLSWKIPWTEELGRLQSIGSQRVGHYWVTKHSTAEKLSYKVKSEKDKHHMISFTCGIQKRHTDECIYKTKMDSDIENSHGFQEKTWWRGINQEFGNSIQIIQYIGPPV